MKTMFYQTWIVLIISVVCISIATARNAPGSSKAPLLTTTKPATTVTPAPASRVCNSKPCVDVAYNMLHNMDDNVNPCEDFYDYSCKGIGKRGFTQPVSTSNEIMRETHRFLKALDLSNEQLLMYMMNTAFGGGKHFKLKRTATGDCDQNELTALLARLQKLFGSNGFIDISLDGGTFKIAGKLSYERRPLISLKHGLSQDSHLNITNLTPKFVNGEEPVCGTQENNLTVCHQTITVETVANTLASLKLDFELYLTTLTNSKVYKKMMSKPEIFQHKFTREKENITNALQYLMSLSTCTQKEEYIKSQIKSLIYDVKDLKKYIRETAGCLQYMMYNSTSPLKYAISMPFMKKFMTPQVHDEATGMVENLRAAAIKLIEKAPWMKPETRDKAIEKLDIRSHDSFDQINFRLKSFQLAKSFEQYVDENEDGFQFIWDEMNGMMLSNAAYIATGNFLIINAGILQPPLFHVDYPKYVNYGALGYIIGHEINHGFDDTGRKFDKNGEEVNWWDNETLAKYENRTQCYVKQYNNITVDACECGRNIDGQNTLGENIADNGAIIQAYNAYRNYVKKHNGGNEEALLPGFPQNITADQLFFQSAAQMWCSDYSPEKIIELMRTDVHAINKYRVNVPFSNYEQAWQTFKCKENTALRLKKTCRSVIRLFKKGWLNPAESF